MGEHSDVSATPSEDEYANARSHDSLLEKHWIGTFGERVETFP